MPNQYALPGVEFTPAGFSTGSKSIQTFASEVAKMSKESMNETTQLMEKLRGAKTMEEVVSLQTSYVQSSFARYADYTRRVGELLTILPLEMAKQSRSMFRQGTEAATHSTEQAVHQAQHVAQEFTPNHQNNGYDNNNQNYNNNPNYNTNQNHDNNQSYNNGNQNYNNNNY